MKLLVFLIISFSEFLVNADLTPTHVNVSIKLKSADGAGISGTTVTLVDDANESASGVTDASGVVSFGTIPEGVYKLNAQKINGFNFSKLIPLTFDGLREITINYNSAVPVDTSGGTGGTGGTGGSGGGVSPTTTFTLDVIGDPTMGSSVSVNVPGFICILRRCTEVFQTASATVVTMTPHAAPGYRFVSYWGTGDPDCADGSLTMNTDHYCVANFENIPIRTVYVHMNGGHGTFREPWNCSGADCTKTFPLSGSTILSITPDAGYALSSWTGDANCSKIPTVISDNLHCTANFTSIPLGSYVEACMPSASLYGQSCTTSCFVAPGGGCDAGAGTGVPNVCSTCCGGPASVIWSADGKTAWCGGSTPGNSHVVQLPVGPQDPIAAYGMDSTGNQVDLTGKGHDLTCYSSTDIPGVIGRAKQSANCFSNSIDFGIGDHTSFTVAAWVQRISDTRTVFFSRGTVAGNAQEWEIYAENGSLKFLTVTNWPQTYILQTPLPINTWAFVVGWYDASAQTMNLQVNNGPVQTTTGVAYGPRIVGGYAGGSNTFYLGGDTDVSAASKIDALTLWKRTLTATERAAAYNNGAGKEYGVASFCKITQSACPNYPTYVGTFPDDYLSASSNQVECMQRAFDYYSWCGGQGPMAGNTTTASYYSGSTLVQTKTVGVSCKITQSVCPNYPTYVGTFEDGAGEVSADRCSQRAVEYYSWCGGANSMKGNATTSNFYSNGALVRSNSINLPLNGFAVIGGVNGVGDGVNYNRAAYCPSGTSAVGGYCTCGALGPAPVSQFETAAKTSWLCGCGGATTAGQVVATVYCAPPTSVISSGQDVVWENTVGVTASGSALTKTAATLWGNGGASSTQYIPSGDGYVEFAANRVSYLMGGLSNTDSSQSYPELKYAIYLYGNNAVYIFENGNNMTPNTITTYTLGDVFRVSVESGIVKYYKNGSLIYTSSQAPTYPLLFDTAFYDTNASITGAKIWSMVGLKQFVTVVGGGNGFGDGVNYSRASYCTGATPTVVGGKCDCGPVAPATQSYISNSYTYYCTCSGAAPVGYAVSSAICR